jgi:hypothetical protein
MDSEFLILATAAIVFIAATMGVMAIGVIFGRPCLRGSCGGVNACPGCPNRPKSPASNPDQSRLDRHPRNIRHC